VFYSKAKWGQQLALLKSLIVSIWVSAEKTLILSLTRVPVLHSNKDYNNWARTSSALRGSGFRGADTTQEAHCRGNQMPHQEHAEGKDLHL